ncbi:peptide chain release factor N(5)-glutamine methyltransferase [Mesoplasma melaleucae]|uniref:peptide chain release factor N(5)-glutamine methyltransferase n=1 Tax=Mesoplasma melaleucae TaxID=81459 RepID=A0A2K8NWW7_9MOLU|nr:peptide chain release factor N(5)-glutamine methyltransferase [Mesoplasma melaleucae]ATZ18342.1 N5-glutamine S-adenosyl-L-methionine-dependent methyltransferase [Mesoplasma melaleucae]
MKNKIIDVLNKLLQNEKLGRSDAIEIISYVTKIEYNEVIINQNNFLSKKVVKHIFKILKSLAKGKPLAYILGYKIFRGHKIIVNKNTLIPRMETEQILDYVNDFIKTNNKNKLNALDLCTGSGCLGISMFLENKQSINKIVISDISKKALKVAKQNVEMHDATSNIELFQSDFLTNILNDKNKFNILVCNPPYIDKNDLNIDDSTLKYEPKLALFAEDNGLFYYKEVIKNINRIMAIKEQFIIVFEIGWKQKDGLETYLNNEIGLKYKWKFTKDYFNNWRNLIIFNKEI